MPRITKLSARAFIVLVLLGLIVGFVFFPDGGAEVAYVLLPGFLVMALLGGLTLFNYRGTADAILGMQKALRRSAPILGPAPSRRLNTAFAVLFVVFGLTGAVAAPFLAMNG